jgi:hypothetical protein
MNILKWMMEETNGRASVVAVTDYRGLSKGMCSVKPSQTDATARFAAQSECKQFDTSDLQNKSSVNHAERSQAQSRWVKPVSRRQNSRRKYWFSGFIVNTNPRLRRARF